MAGPGTPIPYWILENPDGFYYTGYQQKWVSQLHYAAMLSESLAEKLQKRYPGSTVEREMAYDVNPRETLASVGEPEAVAAIASAIRLAKADGLALPTILVHVEKVFNQSFPNPAGVT